MIEVLPTPEMIDAGGKALREKMQFGKKLNPWESLRPGVKAKWRMYAEIVLRAASRAP